MRCLCKWGSSSISVPNLKLIAQIRTLDCRNYEIRSRDPDHAHLGVVLWSQRREAPSFMSVPNLRRVARFVQKLLGGSQNFEIGSRDPGHAHLGVVRRRGPSYISVPNLMRIAQFVQKLLSCPKIWKSGHMTPATPTCGRFMILT